MRIIASPYSFFRLCVRVGKNDARYLTALRKRLFRAMKEPVPSCRTGSSANRKRHCCLLILRKRLCDRVLHKKRKNSVFASGWLSARFDTGISDV